MTQCILYTAIYRSTSVSVLHKPGYIVIIVELPQTSWRHRLNVTVIGHYMMTSFTLLHFAWNRANHSGGTCSQLMSQVGGGKTGNRLRWSIPL